MRLQRLPAGNRTRVLWISIPVLYHWPTEALADNFGATISMKYNILIIIFGIYTRCQQMDVKVVSRKLECLKDIHYKTQTESSCEKCNFKAFRLGISGYYRFFNIIIFLMVQYIYDISVKLHTVFTLLISKSLIIHKIKTKEINTEMEFGYVYVKVFKINFETSLAVHIVFISNSMTLRLISD